jgi:pilus assembly protein Flp/PilA
VTGLFNKLREWLRLRRGQGVVEYALILCLVAIVVVGALSALGDRVPEPMNDVVAQGFEGDS